MDILAPGVDIYGGRGTSYSYHSGTSLSAPVVTGAAALLLGREPGLDPYEAARRLVTAVEPIAAAEGQCRSNGRLYLPKLLETDAEAPATVGNPRVTATATNGASLRWIAPGDDGANAGTAAYYEVRVSKSPITEANFFAGTLPDWLPAPEAAGTAQALHLSGLDAGQTYYAAIRAVDDAGKIGPLGTVVTFTTRATAATAFAESFESGAAGWQAQTPWTLETGNAASGAQSWTTEAASSPSAGSYSLTSPAFSLAGFERPILFFQESRRLDLDYLNSTSPALPTVYGVVEISTNGGGSWTEVARRHSASEPWRRQSVSLSQWAGAASVSLRWRLVIASAASDAIWRIDDVSVIEPADSPNLADGWIPEPATVLAEPVGPQGQYPNPGGAAIYSDLAPSGTWNLSPLRKAIAYVTSPRARRLSVSAAAGASAAYTPEFASDGTYRVWASWSADANASGVVYRVRHAGGESAVGVEQNGASNGGRWNLLGEFYFHAGRSASAGAVVLDASAVTGPADSMLPGWIEADAIRFDYLGAAPPASASAAWMRAGE